MPETVVDEPGIADSPIASIDPKDAARAMAVEAAEDENGVGEFVEAIDAGDGITDYRFVSLMRGYEGWQWSVTMFHDVERDTWTVNESTLYSPWNRRCALRNGFHGRTVCCRPTCR